MGIADIIQTIASVISARVSLKLSQRIAQMSLRSPSSGGDTWMDRSARSGRRIEKYQESFNKQFQRSEQRLQTSQYRVDRATERRDDIRDEYDVAKAARTAGQASGVKGKDLDKLFATEEKYRRQLERATQALKRVTDGHDKLTQALISDLSKSEAKVKSEETAQRIEKAADDRSSQTPFQRRVRKVLARLKRFAGPSVRRFIPSNSRGAQRRQYQRSATAYRKSQANFRIDPSDNNQRIVDRKREEVQRSIERRREATQRRESEPSKNPEVQKRRVDRAQKRLAQAKSDHQTAKAVQRTAKTSLKLARRAYASNPSPRTKSNLTSAKSTFAKSATRVATTEKAVSSAATSVSSLAGSGVEVAAAVATLGAVAEALGAAGAAVLAGIAAVYAMWSAVSAAAEQRVSEITKTRSKWSGDIASDSSRYAFQSMDLERRSTRATAGSGSAVIRSTMALREANQPTSEKIEDIGNTLLATGVDIATAISKAVAYLDEAVGIAGAVSGFISGFRDALESIGITITKIEKNGRKDGQRIDFWGMQQRMEVNEKFKKPQNAPLPPLKKK